MIDGAGTSESYSSNELQKYYNDELEITSSTKVSAPTINERPIHGWYGIGIANKPLEEAVKTETCGKELEEGIKKCTMLAIDEISMVDNFVFDYINEFVKRVRENFKPFGGIQVLLFGDFYQLPPITSEKRETKYWFESRAWK